MNELDFKELARTAMLGEPAGAPEAAEQAVAAGRRTLRRRRALGGLAVAGAAVAIPAAAGLASGLPGQDRMTVFPPTAASAAPSPGERQPLLVRFEALLREAVHDRYAVTRAVPIGDEPSEVDIPPRVSLVLGDDGWVSLRTGDQGVTGLVDCVGADECSERPGADDSRLITSSRTADSGARTNMAAVIRRDGTYVSATASDAVLDPGTLVPGRPSGGDIPVGLDELLRMAVAASHEPR
jgi:hypothetical protein